MVWKSDQTEIPETTSQLSCYLYEPWFWLSAPLETRQEKERELVSSNVVLDNTTTQLWGQDQTLKPNRELLLCLNFFFLIQVCDVQFSVRSINTGCGGKENLWVQVVFSAVYLIGSLNILTLYNTLVL